MEKNILLRVTEEEHEILKQKAKKVRQSLNQYMLSKVLDEEKNFDNMEYINSWIERNKELLSKIETAKEAPRGI